LVKASARFVVEGLVVRLGEAVWAAVVDFGNLGVARLEVVRVLEAVWEARV
jgi:hypothetical protein